MCLLKESGRWRCPKKYWEMGCFPKGSGEGCSRKESGGGVHPKKRRGEKRKLTQYPKMLEHGSMAARRMEDVHPPKRVEGWCAVKEGGG